MGPQLEILSKANDGKTCPSVRARWRCELSGMCVCGTVTVISLVPFPRSLVVLSLPARSFSSFS